MNTVAKHLNVSLENHHRAVDDAKATADIFLICLDILKKKGIQNISEINKKLSNNKESEVSRNNDKILWGLKIYTG